MIMREDGRRVNEDLSVRTGIMLIPNIYPLGSTEKLSLDQFTALTGILHP